MIRRLIVVPVLLFILLLVVPVTHAQTVLVPNTSGTLTQLQLLLDALQELQDQLSFLQTTESDETVASSWSAPRAAVSSPLSTTTAYDIVVVAGQSNSVGFGRGTYTEEAKYTTPENKAKVFQLGRYNGHDMQIVPVLQDPLDFWNMGSAATDTHRGASYPFALRLAATETTGRKVLVIPAAKGGTSILLWDAASNTFKGESSILYDDMIKRTNFALAQNPQNRVVAVIWRQGEADVSALYNPAHIHHEFMNSAADYRVKLYNLRKRIRHDLLPNQGCVPFIFGEMTQQWVPDSISAQTMTPLEAKTAITNATKYIASHDTDTCANKSVFASSTKTTVNPGGEIHFNAAGQFEMAKRMWSAYLKIK